MLATATHLVAVAGLVGSALASVAPAAADEIHTGTVTGRVTDEAGRPVAGLTIVEIVPRPVGPSSQEPSGRVAQTDADGNYSLKVEANGNSVVCAQGAYDRDSAPSTTYNGVADVEPTEADKSIIGRCWRADPERYEPYSYGTHAGDPVNVAIDQIREGIDFTVKLASEVRGHVIDRSGDVLAHTTVRASTPHRPGTPAWTAEKPHTAQTAADGTFTLVINRPAYMSGDYCISVSYRQYSGDQTTEWFFSSRDEPGTHCGLFLQHTTLVYDSPYELLDDAVLTLVNTDRPSFTGSAQVGNVLAAAPGTWNIEPESVTYRWYADGERVASGASGTYKVKPADVGKKMSLVEITHHNDAYKAASEPYVGDETVSEGDLRIRGSVTLSEPQTIGSVVTVTAPLSIPAATVSYLWFRDGVPMFHATRNRYKIRRSDAGHEISVRVNYSAPGYHDTNLFSRLITP